MISLKERNQGFMMRLLTVCMSHEQIFGCAVVGSLKPRPTIQLTQVLRFSSKSISLGNSGQGTRKLISFKPFVALSSILRSRCLICSLVPVLISSMRASR